MTPWQEVRVLAEKWRDDALEGVAHGWQEYATAYNECASDLEALIRDPAFIGMMERAEATEARFWELVASVLDHEAAVSEYEACEARYGETSNVPAMKEARKRARTATIRLRAALAPAPPALEDRPNG
jgi:hypothetical protein